jgi:zinc transporter 1
MGLSKSTRICILLAIDTVFFLIELVTGKSGHRPGRATTSILTKHTGYAVHSLALVADSFHMVSRLPPSELKPSQDLHQWPA